ncbi:MAG: NFACT family protein [bacterium]|nr:NFACT family protein [bacterium]
MSDFPQPIEYDVLPTAVMDYSTLVVIGHVARDVLIDARLRKVIGFQKEDVILSFDLFEKDEEAGEFSSWLISADTKQFRIHQWPDPLPEKNVSSHLVDVMSHHLEGAYVTNVDVSPFERVIELDFKRRDLTGVEINYRLIAELMGKHSNIILVDADGVILASQKAVHTYQSRVREVRAGKPYNPPPKQDRIEPAEFNEEDWKNFVGSAGIDVEIDNHLTSTFMGMSPNWANGICYWAGVHTSTLVSELSQEEREDIRKAFIDCLRLVLQGEPLTGESAKDFVRRVSADFNERADDIALDNARLEITKIIDRRRKKLLALGEGLMKDIDQAEKSDEYKKKADLLLSHMHLAVPGIGQIEVDDWETGEKVMLEIDPFLAPQIQVEKWYGMYRKLQRRKDIALDRKNAVIAEEEELSKIENELAKAESYDEINFVKEQCVLHGLIAPDEIKVEGKGKREEKKSRRPGDLHEISSHRYRSNDGFLIIAGANNVSNDALRRLSSPEDMWLHVRDIPGSHVYIITRGKEVPESTLKEAAMVAAWHSKAKDSSHVPVDYTKAKYVTPIPGGPAGKVKFRRERTVRVTPDENRIGMMKLMAG